MQDEDPVSAVVRILKLTEPNLDALRAAMDEVVKVIGYCALTERRTPPGERANDIRRRLRDPLAIVAKALKDSDFRREFWQPYGKLTPEDQSALEAICESIIERAEAQANNLHAQSSQKYTWDRELKNFHVEECFLFARRFQKDFAPTMPNRRPRGSPLSKLCTIIGAPVFADFNFDYFTGKFVEKWKAEGEALYAEMLRRRGRE